MLNRAAEMRKNLTEPERRLWMELRALRFEGYKFRRQFVINNRIVDFFCPAKGLVIEIDGDTHDAEIDCEKDRRMLSETGFHTFRFSNQDVMQNMTGVLEQLILDVSQLADRWSDARAHHPQTPSSEEDGA